MPLAYISCGCPLAWGRVKPATGVGDNTLGGAPVMGVVAVPEVEEIRNRTACFLPFSRWKQLL